MVAKQRRMSLSTRVHSEICETTEFGQTGGASEHEVSELKIAIARGLWVCSASEASVLVMPLRVL